MTYHPIDKPTEPGWYWLHQCGAWSIEWVSENDIHDSDPPVQSGRGAQFYGPRIEPPQKYEAKMAPQVPRRFRWRNEHGDEGFGVAIGQHYSWHYASGVLFSNWNPSNNDGKSNSFGASIAEWLDPEPS